MKITILLSAALMFNIVAHGQQIKIAEPEYKGNVLLIKGGAGISLEKQKASIKRNLSASLLLVGMGKAKSSSVVEGISSTVRTSMHHNVQFIVKAPDYEMDPTDLINFFQLEVKKDTRLVLGGSSDSFGTTRLNNIKMIPFTAVKYGQSSYLITVEDIKPGEYALTLEGTRGNFNMFGVD